MQKVSLLYLFCMCLKKKNVNCPLWCHKVANPKQMIVLTLCDTPHSFVLVPFQAWGGLGVVFFRIKLWPSIFVDSFKERANCCQYHGLIMLFSAESCFQFRSGPLHPQIDQTFPAPQKYPQLSNNIAVGVSVSFFLAPFQDGMPSWTGRTCYPEARSRGWAWPVCSTTGEGTQGLTCLLRHSNPSPALAC